MIRKFVEKVTDEQLEKDLEKYKETAADLGASDAQIIIANMVVMDERVRAKCMYPKCSSYGLSAHCPPYTPELDQMKKIINKYEYAILIRVDAPTEDVAGPIAKEKDTWKKYGIKRNGIVGKLEAIAFSDAYHFALGFGGGSCKSYFCQDVDCSLLKPGQACRAPLKARPSMEAVGMDVYTMATKAGWDIYPIGENTIPSEVPVARFIGIVFIY
jgi:predicted metal-binding protein